MLKPRTETRSEKRIEQLYLSSSLGGAILDDAKTIYEFLMLHETGISTLHVA